MGHPRLEPEYLYGQPRFEGCFFLFGTRVSAKSFGLYTTGFVGTSSSMNACTHRDVEWNSFTLGQVYTISVNGKFIIIEDLWQVLGEMRVQSDGKSNRIPCARLLMKRFISCSSEFRVDVVHLCIPHRLTVSRLTVVRKQERHVFRKKQ